MAMNRRELLRQLTLAGIGSAYTLDQMLGIKGMDTLLLKGFMDPLTNCFGSLPLIGDALQGGTSLLRYRDAAYGQTADQWTMVTVKVVNHVYTPLVFLLGDIAANGVDKGSSNVAPSPTLRMTNKVAKDTMGPAMNKRSDWSRVDGLFLNQWFANMLRYGTYDGNPADGHNRVLRDFHPDFVQEFPRSDEVALQAFLHLGQRPTGNHSLQNLTLSDEQGDLAWALDSQGILFSPLGATCFNAGNVFDSAEGNLKSNAILKSTDKGTEAAGLNGFSVNDSLNILAQSLSSPHTDLRFCPSGKYDPRKDYNSKVNLSYHLDQIVKGNSQLRCQLLDSLVNLRSQVKNLEVAQLIEKQTCYYPGIDAANPIDKVRRRWGSAQTHNPQRIIELLTPKLDSRGKELPPPNHYPVESVPDMEFLGQCAYTIRSLEMPGQPLRNFSLFLNTHDLDGKNLDVALGGIPAGQKTEIRALSYCEGMRQLAVGMNMFAQSIKKGNKLIVQFISEGGRSAAMGDDTLSFAFVMAPPSILKDKELYANWNPAKPKEGIGGRGKLVSNPAVAAAESEATWYGKKLMLPNGRETTGHPKVSDLQRGVGLLLAQQLGNETEYKEKVLNAGKRKTYVNLIKS